MSAPTAATPARGPSGLWTIVAVIAMLAAAATIGFLWGEGQGSDGEASVTPTVVVIGPAEANISLSTNCDGGSQSSYDGYWECQISLTATTSSVDFFNFSSPQSTNLIVYPPLSYVNPGDTIQTQVTGQLGYTGGVTLFLDVHAI